MAIVTNQGGKDVGEYGEKCSKKMHAGFWFGNLKERDHL
jgi:hypothetical protein